MSYPHHVFLAGYVGRVKRVGGLGPQPARYITWVKWVEQMSPTHFVSSIFDVHNNNFYTLDDLIGIYSFISFLKIICF